MMTEATQTMILAAADALEGHDVDFASSMSGRAMMVCECGKILLDAEEDNYGDMTRREMDEGWHLGRVHFAEIVLEAALKEKED